MKIPSPASAGKRPSSPLNDEQAKKLRLEEVKPEQSYFILKYFGTTEYASCDGSKCRLIMNQCNELLNPCFFFLFVCLTFVRFWQIFDDFFFYSILYPAFPYQCIKFLFAVGFYLRIRGPGCWIFSGRYTCWFSQEYLTPLTNVKFFSGPYSVSDSANCLFVAG